MSDNNVHQLTVKELENLEKKSQIELELGHTVVERKHIENEELKDTWQSCCLRVNKNMLQYLTQTAVLTGVVAFSCVMLAYSSEPRDLWVSLLSTSIGLIIPTGSRHEEKRT